MSDDDERFLFLVVEARDKRREEQEGDKRDGQKTQNGQNEADAGGELLAAATERDVVEQGGKESSGHEAEEVEIPREIGGEVHRDCRLKWVCKITISLWIFSRKEEDLRKRG